MGTVQRDPFALQAFLPPESEADLLIKIFFQNVNPFVRILNRESFSADLTRFRAGQLANSSSFIPLLFSVYGLAVVSLLPSDVAASFGVEKEWLLYKYQEAQELALHQVDFVNSNKLSVFQAFLYYLVSDTPAKGRCLYTRLPFTAGQARYLSYHYTNKLDFRHFFLPGGIFKLQLHW